ncbi:DUF2975 domain-containing protein [Gordonia sp. PDNC005]|uniref:DUF2975 domain-containing protein n=1 Tax=unclassified Gordonia (in: high G+C Gram-positive bacteria) TaxID=2657482 RepID=UPI0019627338|nr:DUF2975 domain-containing protein [Gordonia sp. PDNC005]QRY62647.1 DUF2975 domain-containing protein [Gordonia sp. PDNC005]
MERLTTLVYWPSKAALALLFVGVTVLQTLSFPGKFRYMQSIGEMTVGERWTATVLVAYEFLCLQVVLVAIWVLLGRIRRDRIFDESSFRWVDAIVWAIVGAALLPAGLLVALGLFGALDDPGLPFLLTMVTLGGLVLALLMLVMRSLLRQATTLRSDMDEVI